MADVKLTTGAVLVGLLVAACAAPAQPAGISDSIITTEPPPATCAERLDRVAGELQPAITFDYEPAPSPAALAERASVTFHAHQVTDVTAADGWVVLTVSEVEVVRGDQPEGSPTTLAIEVGGRYDGSPRLDDFDGVELVAFAHEWDPTPGGLAVDIEGLWLGCGAETPAISVIIEPVGAGWPSAPTLSDLVEAARPPSQPDDPEPSAPTPLDVIVLPGDDGSLPADVEVGCPEGPTFPMGALEEVIPLEDMPAVEAAVAGFLQSGEGQHWPQQGWRVIPATDDRVVVVHIGEGVATMQVVREGTEWRWAGSSIRESCPLQVQLPGELGVVEWRLDPDADPPGPENTTIPLLVTERRCASGHPMGDRLVGPDIAVTADAVYIAFAAEPPPGDAQTCPSNPSQRVTVELSEPLGDRELRDGLAVVGDLRQHLAAADR